MEGFKVWVLGTGYWVLGTGYWQTLNPKTLNLNPKTQNPKPKTPSLDLHFLQKLDDIALLKADRLSRNKFNKKWFTDNLFE